jgi:hypothetical protein
LSLELTEGKDSNHQQTLMRQTGTYQISRDNVFQKQK